MAKKKAVVQKELTPEELRDKDYKNLKERVYGDIPEPTYRFEVGDKVYLPRGRTARVISVLDDYRIYELYSEELKDRGSGPKIHKTPPFFRWWFDIRNKPITETSLVCNENMRLSYTNRPISGLIERVYFSGVDMNPSYQRDYVWSASDKVALIDSIFNNRDIGKFVFVERDWEAELNRGDASSRMYEILDGKQRLRAILDFYEERIMYCGLRYSGLLSRDRNYFENKVVSAADITHTKDRQEIIKLFLFLNRSGRVMDEHHLSQVESLLDSE